MIEALSEQELEQEFRACFGRSLGEPADQEVLNNGDPDCAHRHIFYADTAIPHGQAFWCDDCPRHEGIGYSPGFKMRFPSGALISTPNPKYGGGAFYAFRANDEGEAELLYEQVRRNKD